MLSVLYTSGSSGIGRGGGGCQTLLLKSLPGLAAWPFPLFIELPSHLLGELARISGEKPPLLQHLAAGDSLEPILGEPPVYHLPLRRVVWHTDVPKRRKGTGRLFRRMGIR